MIDIFSGSYIRENAEEKSKLTISYLGDSRIEVKGFSIWGKQNTFGPNIGDIEFITEIKGNKAIYKVAFGNSEYSLSLEFINGKIIATENLPHGMFGMNVRFEGEYEKEKTV